MLGERVTGYTGRQLVCGKVVDRTSDAITILPAQGPCAYRVGVRESIDWCRGFDKKEVSAMLVAYRLRATAEPL